VADRRTLKEQPWYVRFNAYGIALGIAVFMFVLVGFMMPFEPFKFYGWRNIPPTVCPLQPFDSSYMSKVSAGPYTIGELEDGAALMLDEDGNVVDSWEYEPIDLKPYPKTEKSSVAVRSAPVVPGEYHFGLQGRVDGRMFFLVPTYQEIDYTGADAITVLPLDNKKCDLERG
jgi:hypothetical protein